MLWEMTVSLWEESRTGSLALTIEKDTFDTLAAVVLGQLDGESGYDAGWNFEIDAEDLLTLNLVNWNLEFLGPLSRRAAREFRLNGDWNEIATYDGSRVIPSAWPIHDLARRYLGDHS